MERVKERKENAAPLTALTALVADGHTILITAIRDGNNISSLVLSTLQLPLVRASSIRRIRVSTPTVSTHPSRHSSQTKLTNIRRIDSRIPSLPKRTISAITPINGIKKVIQEPIVIVILLCWCIVGLEEDGLLGVEERDCELEVKFGFAAAVGLGLETGGAVDGVLDWAGAGGDGAGGC